MYIDPSYKQMNNFFKFSLHQQKKYIPLPKIEHVPEKVRKKNPLYFIRKIDFFVLVSNVDFSQKPKIRHLYNYEKI